jgi:hypothetical protein
MTSIGVYTLDTSELRKPPKERTYECIGCYNTSTGEWTDSTDPRLQCVLPDSRDNYTLDELRATLESPTIRVFREDQAPDETAVYTEGGKVQAQSQ